MINREVSRTFRDAYALARQVPDNARWSVMITHDSGIDLPTAFNVYVSDRQERIQMRDILNRGVPVWEGQESEEHNYSPRVTLGIIQEDK